MSRILAATLLFAGCLRLQSADDPQVLLTQAQSIAAVVEALPLLERVQGQLDAGLPDSPKVRAALWLALADERTRRWQERQEGRTGTELELLYEAHLKACREAVDAEDWNLVRSAASRVWERIGTDDLRAAAVRRIVADCDRIACRSLGDKVGEGRAIIHALRARDEPVQLGERRSETVARRQRRLAMIAEARQLLGDASRIALDDLELDERSPQPLSERLPLLLRALDYATSQGKQLRLSKHRDQAHRELETAVRGGAVAAWTPEVRASALQLWQMVRREADTTGEAVSAKERARGLIDRLQDQQIAKILAGEPLSSGVHAEIVEAVRHLPSPVESDDIASAWLEYSREAERLAPEGQEWLAWARAAYAGRAGVSLWCQGGEIRIAGSEAAMDWESRSLGRHDPVRRICLQEAAAAWEELGRRSGNWEALVRSEECLRMAQLPAKGLLPAIDPASDASQGPDAPALDRACRELAAIPVGGDCGPALGRLLALLHLTQSPPEQRAGEGFGLFAARPYWGRLGGIQRASLVWHAGSEATSDLAVAASRHELSAAVDLIGMLGGKHAAGRLAELWPHLLQRPNELANHLPALQQGSPAALAGWLDELLPRLDDQQLTSLAWVAGRCLREAGLNRVAQEVFARGNGDILRSTLNWWASERKRIDAPTLLRLWQRVAHWKELCADLTTCMVATGDERVGWWLLGIAENSGNQLAQVEALNGLGLLHVREGGDLCERLLLWNSEAHCMEAAALLNAAALGRGERVLDKARSWIRDVADDPEDVRVRAAHCLLLAMTGDAQSRAWVDAAADPFALRLVRDLCRTRQPGACAPAFVLAKQALRGWEGPRASRHDERRQMERYDGLARDASKLPLDPAQHREWEQLLGRPLPPPSPDALPIPSWEMAAHAPAPGW